VPAFQSRQVYRITLKIPRPDPRLECHPGLLRWVHRNLPPCASLRAKGRSASGRLPPMDYLEGREFRDKYARAYCCAGCGSARGQFLCDCMPNGRPSQGSDQSQNGGMQRMAAGSHPSKHTFKPTSSDEERVPVHGCRRSRENAVCRLSSNLTRRSKAPANYRGKKFCLTS
jgi:hypothetical protein